MVIMGLDPGIRHMGYAVLDDEAMSITSGVILTDRRDSLQDRICEIMDALESVLLAKHVSKIVMEDMQIFFRARLTKGLSNTFKLHGALQTFQRHGNISRLYIFTPAKWQTEIAAYLGLKVVRDKKDAINRKLSQAFDIEYTYHETDALGLCLYLRLLMGVAGARLKDFSAVHANYKRGEWV